MKSKAPGPDESTQAPARPHGWRRAQRGGYAAARKRPLTTASRTKSASAPGRNALGPYETRYDVRSGYDEVNRNLVRP